MQPEPSLSQEPQVESPVTKGKKKFPLLAVLFVVVLLALAGVGYWAFTLNTNLKATQAELAALQKEYDGLTAEKNTLASDLVATKSELEKTKGELSTAQSDLSASKDEAAALRVNMEKAQKYVDIAIAMIVKNERESVMVEKVNATGDSKLKSLWDAYKAAPLDFSTAEKLLKWSTALKEFQGYLFDAITDLLK